MSMEQVPRRTMVIVGSGPDLGMALARRFGREGFRIGLVARSRDRLDAEVKELADAGITAMAAQADVRDTDALKAAIAEVVTAYGPIDVLEYSPMLPMGALEFVTDISLDLLHEHLALDVGGAMTAVSQVLPAMLERGAGALLFTAGGSIERPLATHGSGSVVHGALRSYLDALHDAVAHRGVLVGSLAICRTIPRAEVADLFWDMFRDGGPRHVVCGDPDSMHAFQKLVIRGHAEAIPPRLVDPPQPTTDAEKRELLLALNQARLTASYVPDPTYLPWLDELVRAQGGDPTAPRCGVP